jgi:hypothetical protein
MLCMVRTASIGNAEHQHKKKNNQGSKFQGDWIY